MFTVFTMNLFQAFGLYDLKAIGAGLKAGLFYQKSATIGLAGYSYFKPIVSRSRILTWR